MYMQCEQSAFLDSSPTTRSSRPRAQLILLTTVASTLLLGYVASIRSPGFPGILLPRLIAPLDPPAASCTQAPDIWILHSSKDVHRRGVIPNYPCSDRHHYLSDSLIHYESMPSAAHTPDRPSSSPGTGIRTDLRAFISLVHMWPMVHDAGIPEARSERIPVRCCILQLGAGRS
ncbi:hypothetical protein DENSPDRAFT_405304 [Dentipellis sp. KUC8613]|nr:hypothetical protein DENSPDRAFT_405304 [Dentipellis sp. KUC8613]